MEGTSWWVERETLLFSNLIICLFIFFVPSKIEVAMAKVEVRSAVPQQDAKARPLPFQYQFAAGAVAGISEVRFQ